MKFILTTIFFLSIGSVLLLAGENPPGHETNWFQWRGPYATGEALQGNPPIEWNEDKNIKWKTEIPGFGHATPIVWGDHLIVQSAVQVETASTGGGINYRFVVLSVDRNNGKINWEQTVQEEIVQERTHDTASMASNSPITDGKHIYAYFGSRGLYCLDFDGNIIWERDFGHLQKRSNFGEGSSPALYDDKLVILWDHEGQSSLYCIDKNTGRDIWNVNRNEPSSWTTPLIIDYDGKVQVIASATNKVRSYRLENGEVIWEWTVEVDDYHLFSIGRISVGPRISPIPHAAKPGIVKIEVLGLFGHWWFELLEAPFHFDPPASAIPPLYWTITSLAIGIIFAVSVAVPAGIIRLILETKFRQLTP